MRIIGRWPERVNASPVVLVPPPRVHGLRCHGLFAPNSKARSRVVPAPPVRVVTPPAPQIPTPGASEKPRREKKPASKLARTYRVPVGRPAPEGVRTRRARLPRVRRPNADDRLHRPARGCAADPRSPWARLDRSAACPPPGAAGAARSRTRLLRARPSLPRVRHHALAGDGPTRLRPEQCAARNVTLRCFAPEDLTFGRTAPSGGRTAFVNADIRLGRTQGQKRRLALAFIDEIARTWVVAREAVYVIFTEHDGEDFRLSDRVLPSWSAGEDPLADKPVRRASATRHRKEQTKGDTKRRRARRR
jgi:hypothetical protein